MGVYPNHDSTDPFYLKIHLLKTNMSPEKGAHFKREVVLLKSYNHHFSGGWHVSFRAEKNKNNNASWEMAAFLHHDSRDDFHHGFRDFPKERHCLHGAILSSRLGLPKNKTRDAPWVTTVKTIGAVDNIDSLYTI